MNTDDQLKKDTGESGLEPLPPENNEEAPITRKDWLALTLAAFSLIGPIFLVFLVVMGVFVFFVTR